MRLEILNAKKTEEEKEANLQNEAADDANKATPVGIKWRDIDTGASNTGNTGVAADARWTEYGQPSVGSCHDGL